MVLHVSQPLRLRRPTTNRLFLIGLPDRPRLLKVYEGWRARERRDAEFELLRYWAAAGLGVPEVSDEELPFTSRPHLLMAYVAAERLQDALADRSRPAAERLALLGGVLAQFAHRHARAVADRDRRLVLADANTGNFLLADDAGAAPRHGTSPRPHVRLVHLDLESSPRDSDVVDAAARELTRFVRWAARDLGAKHLDEAAGLAARAYRAAGRAEVVLRAARRTLDRRGDAFHRWRDTRRRTASPADVSKYAVATALLRQLGRAAGG